MATSSFDKHFIISGSAAEQLLKDIEDWENGNLGRSEDHVSVSTLKQEQVDEALDMKMISIRMPKKLLDDLKLIADYNHIGYQTLAKQVLRKFAFRQIQKIKQLKEEQS